MSQSKHQHRLWCLIKRMGILGVVVFASTWSINHLHAQAIDGASTGALPLRPFQIYMLQLPDGSCHPNPVYPQSNCGSDNLPVGDDAFFQLGIFDTGSEFVIIDNNLESGAWSSAHVLEVCRPNDPPVPQTNCVGPFFPQNDPTGRSKDPFIPPALNVRAWGLGVVNDTPECRQAGNCGILPEDFFNPKDIVEDVRIRVTKGIVRRALIGASLAKQILAHIDFTNPVNRVIFGFSDPVLGAGVEFFLPGAPGIPDPLYEVDIEWIGDTGPGFFDDATKAQRPFLKDFAFHHGNNVLEEGDVIADSPANSVRALFDTGNSKTQITEAAAAALEIQLPAVCNLPDCVELPDGVVNGQQVFVKCPKIDAFEMTSNDGTQQYVIENPFVCVKEGLNTFTGTQDPNEASDIIIGMNYFAQTHFLLDGPGNTLGMFIGVPTEIEGDFDGNGVVDCSDYKMLMADIQRPSQPISIEGYTRIGYVEFGNTLQIQYTADDMVKISNVTYDFTGKNVIYNPDRDNIGDETQIFNHPKNNSTIDEDIIWIVNLDQLLTGTGTPVREDYIGGKVTLEIIDSTIMEANFNTIDSEDLAQDFFGAAARFAADIQDFRPPSDPIFDLNEDGIVNKADAEALVGLFDHPEDAPCDF